MEGIVLLKYSFGWLSPLEGEMVLKGLILGSYYFGREWWSSNKNRFGMILTMGGWGDLERTNFGQFQFWEDTAVDTVTHRRQSWNVSYSLMALGRRLCGYCWGLQDTELLELVELHSEDGHEVGGRLGVTLVRKLSMVFVLVGDIALDRVC